MQGRGQLALERWSAGATSGWGVAFLILCLLPVAGCLGNRSRRSASRIRGSGAPPPPDSPATIRELCDQGTPEQHLVEVFFARTERGCPWGEAGNLGRSQGRITARKEQRVDILVPDDGLICDLDFEFQVDPSFEQILEYDDNFLLAFNDGVLAASYGPMVEVFEQVDDLYVYDWSRLGGYPIDFDPRVPHYCLGESLGLADCTVPPPEVAGPIALEFDTRLVDQLSYLAESEQRYEFLFVTLGDNDRELDCFHEDFLFQVELSYLPLAE